MKKLFLLILLVAVTVFCYFHYYPERNAKKDVEIVKNFIISTNRAGKVKMAISLHKHFDVLDIKVSAKGGHVVLSGETKTEELRELAENIAIWVDGVESVENLIELK